MRKKKHLAIGFFVIGLLLILIVPSAKANVLSINEIRADQSFQGAEIGFGSRLLFTVGLDAAFLNMNYIESYGFESYEMDISGSLIIPNGGIKLYLSSSEVRPYLRGNIFRTFPSVSLEMNGQEMLHYETQERIEDILTVTGGKLGFGAEYRINESIGLVGETGMRFLYHSVDIEDGYNEIRQELKTTLGFTYTSLGVNFYF